MINLYIREHGTHNMGWSFDFKADLDNYTSDTKLLEDLFEYTRITVAENGLDYDDLMEEWLITDYEFEGDFNMSIDEYTSLSKLIDLNTKLNEYDETSIAIISILLENGYSTSEVFEKLEDVSIYEGTVEETAYSMVEEGLMGDINGAGLRYFDYEMLARDLEIDGYEYYSKYNLTVHIH